MDTFNLRYLKPNTFIFFLVVIAIVLYLANNFISNQWGVSISIVAFVSGFLALMNRFLWSVKPFSWLYHVPDFRGRYEGTLNYEYRDEKCELVSECLQIIKIIHQNGSNIIIHSWIIKQDGSHSSKSTSLDASIIKQQDGTYKLISNYLNEGNPELGFPPHFGTEVVELIKNNSSKSLSGKYYTERMPYQTRGRLSAKYISKNLVHEK